MPYHKYFVKDTKGYGGIYFLIHGDNYYFFTGFLRLRFPYGATYLTVQPTLMSPNNLVHKRSFTVP